MRIIRLRGVEMQRKDLIKKLRKNGWWLLRSGSKHDIYTNGIKNEPIPRHREIDELLAKAIIKRNGLK
jgi:mRNA interferase HicA